MGSNGEENVEKIGQTGLNKERASKRVINNRRKYCLIKDQ